jgi:lambda family phage portal protein
MVIGLHWHPTMNPFQKLTGWVRSLFGTIFGGFEAARYSPSRSHLNSPLQSARFDVSDTAQPELVRKSRYFEQNSPIVQRLLDLFESYTVGGGLNLQPSSSSPEFNVAAKRAWDGWCRYPDLTSLQTFGTLQGLIVRTWFVDGEVFILKTRGESGRPRLQLIESHLVRTPPNLASDPSVIQGIKIDGNGRPIAYHVASEVKRGEYSFPAFPVSASNIIHVFEPCRPGQYRGLPFLYAAMNDLHDLDDLQLLEMAAAKEAAASCKVIKTSGGAVSKNNLAMARFKGGTTLSTGTAAQESKVDYYRTAVPGSVTVLEKNDELSFVESNRPNVTTQAYWRYLVEKVCSGVGIPYVMAFPESVQGTVYRGTLDASAAWFRARSAVLQAAILDVYAYVMSFERYKDPVMRENMPIDWYAARLYPPRAVNVDVGRNSSAMLAELEAGATDYEMIYGPLGYDWRERFDALKMQRDYAASIGLALGKPAPATVQVEAPEDAEPDPEDENDAEETKDGEDKPTENA